MTYALGRNGAFTALALAVLAVLVASALQVASLLASSIYDTARENAGEDAELIADLGLAEALSDGELTESDKVAAGREFTAARRSHPLLAASVWDSTGRLELAVGNPDRADARRVPPIARKALVTRTTKTADVDRPALGPSVEAAVVVATGGRRYVADFSFSRRAVEQRVAAARRGVYIVIGISALLFYVALLPLLIRIARRLPQPLPGAPRHRFADLRRALDNDELRVHYQPKVDTRSGRTVGVEALVRWQHPQRGLIAPAEFVPYAEQSPELITALTERVLAIALRDCARWRSAGHEVPVAVNVAAPALFAGQLVSTVREVLGGCGLPPRLLTLELTESAVMKRDTHAAAVLGELRDMGISVALDDFGTGYSSLARLRTLPLDELKVDRSFVQALATDDRQRALVQLVVDFGANFGLPIVAEGVEDELTLGLLRDLGCAVAQGYLFSPPLPGDELLAWLERSQPLAAR
jgi:EAL domain-containing protein (putative c-di-GMP-specific phosphodiesterase class I)